MLEIGQPAPTFTLPADSGGSVNLEDLRGRTVVLYFYPKDDTPGCTRQACGIRDNHAEFERANAVVLGVSPQSVESHDRFKAKHSLPFPLLADQDHALAEGYGVWIEKTRYGKTYMGIERSAFVIDADGKLAAVKRRVNPDAHAEWALGEVRRLAGAIAAG